MFSSLVATVVRLVRSLHGSPPRVAAGSKVAPVDDGIPRRAYRPDELQETSHLQRSIFCPITGLPMCDPVQTADGFSYERDAISHWFGRNKRTSPSTGCVLTNVVVVPNHSLRMTVHELIHASSHARDTS